MKTQSVSILVITRNRSGILNELLRSLVAQSIKALEVIIVDNGSYDDTKKVCKKYAKSLPIRYIYEETIGIPAARNASIKAAKGSVCAFIDDDCIADTSWIKQICATFTKNTVDAVIGFSESHTANPIQLVEQTFYYRWLLSVMGSISRSKRIFSGVLFDFKNCAVRTSVLKKTKTHFTASAPHGDVGDEDVEFGVRLFKLCRQVVFDPHMRVRHRNSSSIFRLWQRNFYNGVSNFVLLHKHQIDLRNAPIRKRVVLLWRSARANSQLISSLSGRCVYFILVAIHPLWYMIGRWYSSIFGNTKDIIPQRN